MAAIAEIESAYAAWLEERIAALARESEMPAGEIRDILPPDFAGAARDEAAPANATLALHRYLVQVDPRVDHGGGDELLWERGEDLKRMEELVASLNAAVDSSNAVRERRITREAAAISRELP